MVTITSTTAFAAVVEGQTSAYDGGKEIDSKLYDKQVELDQFLFGEGAKDIEKMGFKVTSTSLTDSQVVIGIAPFSEENADYLYEVFGKELIKIVEEDQSIVYNPNIAYTQAPDSGVTSTDPAEPSVSNSGAINGTDASQAAESGITVNDDGFNASDTSVNDDAEAADMEVTSVEESDVEVQDKSTVNPEVLMSTSGEALTESEENSMIPIVLLGIAGALVIIGGTVFWIKKRNHISR